MGSLRNRSSHEGKYKDTVVQNIDILKSIFSSPKSRRSWSRCRNRFHFSIRTASTRLQTISASPIASNHSSSSRRSGPNWPGSSRRSLQFSKTTWPDSTYRKPVWKISLDFRFCAWISPSGCSPIPALTTSWRVLNTSSISHLERFLRHYSVNPFWTNWLENLLIMWYKLIQN